MRISTLHQEKKRDSLAARGFAVPDTVTAGCGKLPPLVIPTDLSDDQKHSEARVRSLTAALGLLPHPEGGFFAEHYRASDGSQTAIYYLLRADDFSAWHRVGKDELWHHYEGAPIELHVINEAEGARPARYERLVLGSHLDDGIDALPCRVVAAGAWQAARPRGAYALVGNTIAPGFDFRDWALADDATIARLVAAVPDARDALRALAPRKPGG